MSDTDDSLLREVDDEIRREKLAKLWDKYGIVAIVAAGALVASVLGYQWWQSSVLQQAETYGTKYREALIEAQTGKTDAAARTFEEIARDGPKGYAVLARLKLAGAKVKAGERAEAVKLYEAVINDGGADELLAGYARLQAASLRAGEADWTEMKNRLNDLAGDDSPWRHSARELLGIEAQRAGKLPEARKYFEQLMIDRTVPRNIGSRVRIMMAIVAEAELAAGTSAKSLPPPGGTKALDKKPDASGKESN